MSVIAVVTALLVPHRDFRLAVGIFMVVGFIALLLVAQRGLVRRWLFSSHNRVRVLIYAPEPDADLFTIIHTISGQALDFEGLPYNSHCEPSRDKDDMYCRLLGTLDELQRAAEETGATHLLVVGHDAATHDSGHIVKTCERLRLNCSILLDPRTLLSDRHAYTFVHELPVLQHPSVAVRAHMMQLKRAIDIVIGSLLLVLTLPIDTLIAAFIKYDSGGPIFFRQERIGKNGRPFELLKFRTMHTWAPKYHRSPTTNSDPRITRIGRLLRRFSLDELPQLLNVVKGDMSLVGPRPEMPFIVAQYNAAARARLAVRPGITGLWQISRGRSLPIHHNLHYDLFYIERHSIFLDAAILLRTLGAVVRGIGAA